VLRETAVIADTVSHLEAMADGHDALVIVVTTARECAEGVTGVTTADLVTALAASSKVVHLHYPDPTGLKADQVNFAVEYCATTLLGGIDATEAFVVMYDADSRPPLDSLALFELAIRARPEVSVFHQSAAFELRGHGTSLGRWICDGGALRANRFVTGFEIPRLLNRDKGAPRWKRRACSYVYAHVTGHGLCVRVPLLRELPLPARSPLEDMHWSFRLCARNIPVVALSSLDVAEVPDRPAEQLRQAARWFFGPGRALSYLRDPMIPPGWRARVLAASALGSAGEWLACALVPPLTVAAIAVGDAALRALALALVAVYAAQLAVTEAAVGAPGPLARRLTRALACPLAAMVFGIGGFVGAVRLVGGASGIGKTERRHAS
jgi:hypothetical protein